MTCSKRQIVIIKFLQETTERFSRTKIGFMTLNEAREYCRQRNSIVSHHYSKDGKHYMWFSDNHLYGYKDEKNKLIDCVPSSSHLPSTAVARPGLESGIVSNLDDWMVVYYSPERGDVLIEDFNQFVRFIDEHNLYTGE